MGPAADEDWPVGQIIVVPHAWRDDSLWTDIQSETHDRIGTNLQAMYAGLLQQSVSPPLMNLAREIETRLATPQHAG
ncbi:hypothetical protein [Microvirga lotononidis]|uniref:Uncharacterized protein n=1 Tax=Microvirga lotononidis TaxID=864069 RepID=I4YSF6_9HYPH|nr:hypothetical protein [Microvirga lotononidis]EIM26898.1 hypothetical protein MicloDRAFT_00034490 [Microvirga lotononidis]WQO31449.1 hypothetical protein U0023_34765 [Microvirga lotononidis]